MGCSPPRPRRHLPSPALAQAKSLLKLQSFASFDISELSGHHLSSISSSPSAPVVSSSAVAGASALAAGRKLPIPRDRPGSSISCMSSCSSASSIHFSHNDLMAGDFGDDVMGMAAAAAGSRSMARDSPKPACGARKLPAPPISAISMNQTRRLLPRPMSCDVPDVADLIGPAATRALLSRPFSFDFASDDVELHALNCAAELQRDSQSHQHPPPLSDYLSVRSGLIRQSSTSSCPALVRPCLSPRSPKFRTVDAYSSSLSTSLSTTPSPHRADPDAFVPSGILVPLPPLSTSPPSRPSYFRSSHLLLPSSFESTIHPIHSIHPIHPIHPPQRQASLPPAAVDSLAVRRQRYHGAGGGGSASLSSSIQECSSYADHFDVQRPSRSRQAVRNAVSFTTRYSTLNR